MSNQAEIKDERLKQLPKNLPDDLRMCGWIDSQENREILNNYANKCSSN